MEQKTCMGGHSRGVTLIDTVVGTALMLVVFVGIAATFQLSVNVITNNKARSGGIALANERLEYIRSLQYNAVGTVGGTPPGSIAASEQISQNGLSYTRRTIVVYGDDPKDGTGNQDNNHITTDYKAAKVVVSWDVGNGTRSLSLTTRVSPPVVEQ